MFCILFNAFDDIMSYHANCWTLEICYSLIGYSACSLYVDLRHDSGEIILNDKGLRSLKHINGMLIDIKSLLTLMLVSLGRCNGDYYVINSEVQ